MHRLLNWTALAASMILVAGTCEAGEAGVPRYRLKVWVEPALHQLRAEAWIEHPPSSRFYLYRGFTIERVEADGKRAAVHEDASAPPLPYSQGAVARVVEVQGVRELHVSYAGQMNETLAGVNMIAPELVELACYSAWYPAFVGLRRYEFEMQADVPEGFLTTTNGEESGRRTSGGRVVTQWKSFQPGFDIVLLASSRLKGTAGGRPDARVEIYSDRLPRELLKSKTDGLAEAMRALSGRYGAPRLKGNLRLVYSPRAGWGYSRIPLVVVSEERAVRIVGEENGEARDFRDNAHELAHFWWMVADPSKPDDWINEGGAEFSAFRVSKARFGASFAETLLAGYRKNVRRSKTASAIAETETASPDREVNRYDKPALILLEAQRRYGEDALDGVLKAVHVRFAGSGEATTVVFLAEVRSQLGEEAEAYFREELYRRVPPPS